MIQAPVVNNLILYKILFFIYFSYSISILFSFLPYLHKSR